ncbi:hypothetical protein M430DRAFT_42438 [Amorphotheca resinae ATCC 22711]|uniref:Uncharacterized protein n=1 Tax=Amorphotheca resinae ATCC 22711 TaxID=857342 RepID=A0A2T3B2M2_AMORE|nr:hypothetical protein M430DRAFT_42438 [Amorphotheca resinae ATCC 22711]PSS18804.1 hypothetical protein M430DRAFT_42438 [Amorphotheca resinae ATCC 22711]
MDTTTSEKWYMRRTQKKALMQRWRGTPLHQRNGICGGHKSATWRGEHGHQPPHQKRYMRRKQKSADATTHGEVNNGHHYIRKLVYAEDTRAPHGEVNTDTNHHIRRGICGGTKKHQWNPNGRGNKKQKRYMRRKQKASTE